VNNLEYLEDSKGGKGLLYLKTFPQRLRMNTASQYNPGVGDRNEVHHRQRNIEHIMNLGRRFTRPVISKEIWSQLGANKDMR